MKSLTCIYDKYIFRVNIDLNKTVETLIRVIKKKGRIFFKDTPLDAIMLHGVDIPNDDNTLLQEFKQQDDHTKDVMKMDPKAQLSEYFDGEENALSIHVIIGVSAVSIFFFI